MTASVNGDNDGILLQRALREHSGGFRQRDFMAEFRFREKPLWYDPWFSSASFSPYHYRDGIRDDRAVLSVSGWFNGTGYANGAISRFLALAGNPAISCSALGSWSPCRRLSLAWQRACGEVPPVARAAPHFRRISAALRYRTAARATGALLCHARGAVAWCRRLASSRGRKTVSSDGGQHPGRSSRSSGRDCCCVDFSFGTGSQNRYERIGGIAVTDYYPESESTQSGLPHWDGPTLPEDMELSGHAMVTLRLRCSEPNAALHVFLSELEANGRVRCVTEGLLHALHRKDGEAPDN